VRTPPSVQIGCSEKPCAVVGTRNIEMPRCFFEFGSVRAASQM
jgi:hypothetical protein